MPPSLFLPRVWTFNHQLCSWYLYCELHRAQARHWVEKPVCLVVVSIIVAFGVALLRYSVLRLGKVLFFVCDARVVPSVSSKVTQEDRGSRWPAVFQAKGLLRTVYDSATNNFKYALLFGEHNMFGFEGQKENLPARSMKPITHAQSVTPGLVAQNQNTKHDFIGVHEQAGKVRGAVKELAKSETKRKRVPLKRTRWSIKADKEEEASEDEVNCYWFADGGFYLFDLWVNPGERLNLVFWTDLSLDNTLGSSLFLLQSLVRYGLLATMNCL